MAADTHLDGELVSFQFRTDDGAFAVARVRPQDEGGEVIAVGPLGHVNEGQFVRLEGQWSTHPSFGRQFKVTRFLVEDPRTLRGLERYLSSGAVQGLGPAFAKRVVEHFGLDTMRVIEEEPHRLREVEGIGEKRAAEITRHWALDRKSREVSAMLRGFGIGQALTQRIVERYGDNALVVITKHPYRLCELRGVGFRTADTIARENGLAKDDPERVEAALLYTLEEAERDGHTFLPESVLLEGVQRLDVPREAARMALDRLDLKAQVFREDAVLPENRPIALPELHHAEALVARLLCERARASASTPPDVSRFESRLGLHLNADQRRAVAMALSHPVSVITGGPGTGKTTIVRVLIEAARSRQEQWKLAAPTGRAARRLHESTGAEASTIHRLLEFNVRTGGFTRDAGTPLECDGVLVDEASMIDARLMASLVMALPQGAPLVLVGDQDQLPSVGPGRVLGDLIRAGVVPVATLVEVYRQAQDSGIVKNAHRINRGEAPLSGEREGKDDFFLVARDDPDDARRTLLQVVTQRLPQKGFHPLEDVQVLTPMHQGPLGTVALNAALQQALNPAGPELKRGQTVLRQGDRVIQVRNDYDAEIFNGDVGTIVAVQEKSLLVRFDGREVLRAGEGIDDLELAYAISIHKSQGSEYPAVVVALHRSHRIMLRRNLLYTAVTRAKRFCCVVGSPWAIETACREASGGERWTRLQAYLQEGA